MDEETVAKNNIVYNTLTSAVVLADVAIVVFVILAFHGVDFHFGLDYRIALLVAVASLILGVYGLIKKKNTWLASLALIGALPAIVMFAVLILFFINAAGQSL